MKIKSIKELPRWFPLTIYGQDLTSQEWADEICYRLVIETVWGNTKDRESCRNRFLSIIVKRNRGSLAENKAVMPTLGLNMLDVAFMASVLLDCDEGRDALALVDEMRDAKYLGEFYENNQKKIESLKGKTWGDFGKLKDGLENNRTMIDYVDKPYFYMKADLGLDDESLRAGFKILIEHLRTYDQRPKILHRTYGVVDFQKWKKYNVLAAFDLTLWGMICGHSYTDSLIARVIYSVDDEVDITERYRKVTKPKLLEVFNFGTVQQLNAIASWEVKPE